MAAIITENPSTRSHDEYPALLVDEHSIFALTKSQELDMRDEGTPFVPYSELPCATRWRLLAPRAIPTSGEMLLAKLGMR